jgi:glutathione S-transferase
MADTMILIGQYVSPFARRVAITLTLYGLPFTHSPYRTVADADAIAKLNPLGRIPVLQLPGGEVIVDSAMIVDYLDEQVGAARAFIPPTGKERQRINRVVAIAMGACDKYVQAYYESTRRPADKVWQGWLDHLSSPIMAALAALDRECSVPWFLGDRMTHADIAVVCTFQSIEFDMAHLVPKGRYPKLEALCARAMELPAFAATYPSE